MPILRRSLPLLALVALACSSQTDNSDFQMSDQRIYWMEDSVSWVEIKDGKFGIYWDGQPTIEPVYDIDDLMSAIRLDNYAYFPDGAHFALGRDGKWGVMDNYGTVVIPFEYEHVKIQQDDGSFVTRFAGVKKDGKYAIAGPDGALLTGFDYDEFYGDFHWQIHERPVIAMHKGKRVVFYDLDNKAELAEAPEEEFKDPTATVRYKGKAGVITRDGNFIVPPQFDRLGLAGGTGPWYYTVCDDQRCGVWLTGKGLVLPQEYETATTQEAYGKMFYFVSKDSHYAVLNGNGEPITDFDYDDLLTGEPDGIVGWKGEKSYQIDEKGNAKLVEGN